MGKLVGLMTNIFSYIFTILFLILGGLLWCLLLVIVCIGAIGIIKVMIISIFDFDFVKWIKKRNNMFKLNLKRSSDE